MSCLAVAWTNDARNELSEVHSINWFIIFVRLCAMAVSKAPAHHPNQQLFLSFRSQDLPVDLTPVGGLKRENQAGAPLNWHIEMPVTPHFVSKLFDFTWMTGPGYERASWVVITRTSYRAFSRAVFASSTIFSLGGILEEIGANSALNAVHRAFPTAGEPGY